MDNRDKDIASCIENAVLDIKGLDVVSIDMKGKSDTTDVMMICTGTSTRHTTAIAEKVKRSLKSEGFSVYGIEGITTGDWVLVDAGSVVLHVMVQEARDLYQLEKLYRLA